MRLTHEFGHTLGLPDMYDYDGSSNGVGTWCLMGSGSWGADWYWTTEDTPTHMSAWCKVDLGWIIPDLVVNPIGNSIPPVETSHYVMKLWEDAYQGGRFFLVENRIRTGFDQDIYGQGLLIWHCNEEVCFNNYVDNYRLLDLEEADGLNQLDNKTSWMDAGDVYPGTSNKTDFDDASSPNARDVFGAVTGVDLASIAYVAGPGSNVSCLVMPRNLEGFTISYLAHTPMWGWGSSSSQINHGATVFTMPQAGELFAVQAGVHDNTPVGYTVKIFDQFTTMPVGLLSTTSGSFPNYPNDRYKEIALPSPLTMANGEDFVVDVAWGPDNWAVPYCERRSASGQSYYSQTGASTLYNWNDKDVLLRARVRYPSCACGGSYPSFGDVNCDTEVNPMDVVIMVNYVYKSFDQRCGNGCCAGWNCPNPPGDVTCEGDVNPIDAVHYVNYVYKNITPFPCDPCAP